MSQLGCKEGSRLVGLVLAPEGVDDPDPHIAQGAHRHAVGLAFLALALIVGLGPGFLEGALPGKLEERVAQGFDTRMPLLYRGMLATLKGNR